MHIVVVTALLLAPAAPAQDALVAAVPIDASAFVPAAPATLPSNGVLHVFASAASEVSMQPEDFAVAVNGALVETDVVTLCSFDRCTATLHARTATAGDALTVALAESDVTLTYTMGPDVDDTPPVFAAGAPLFDDAEAVIVNPSGTDESKRPLRVRFTLPQASDDGLVVGYGLVENGSPLPLQSVALAGDRAVVDVTIEDATPRLACFDVVAEDAAGNQATLDEQACIDLATAATAASCASTSSSTFATLCALLLATGGATRRRRSHRAAA
jgi:hypothetical protein